ncbi:hypothetical protein NQZ79_g7912 [Umbelopsis isabellina]|nr:hypothetical protein NQZ79_g7912 [Umbelopsis isabellina]
MTAPEEDLEEVRPNSCSAPSPTIDTNDSTASAENQQPSTKEKIKKKMDLLGNPYFSCFLLIVAGCCLAVQAGANATLNKYGGRSFAATISFATGLLAVLIFFAIDVTALGTPLPTSKLTTAPAYAWIGGVCGAYYVIVNVLTVPRLGAATVLSVFVCSQVIFASIIDHFALLGVPQRDYTVWRILASLGLVGCVVVIAKF